jgi:signal transduction histidine kinase
VAELSKAKANHRVARGTVILFLPWLLVFSLTAVLGYRQLVDSRTMPLYEQRLEAIESVSHTIFSALATLERDALYLSRNDIVREFDPQNVDHLAEQKEKVKDLFSSFSVAYLHYAQIRWIDADGMEQVRCEQQDREVYCLKDEDLQNKADRYYFQQGLNVDAGKIFLSRLDLNVENWAIQVPYIPTIRSVAPIFGADGKRVGVVVINFNARTMLDDVVDAGHGFNVPLFMVNGRGQWIIGERPGDSWAHLLGSSGNSFANRYPRVWSHLGKSQRTWISAPSGAWIGREFELGISSSMEDSTENGESLIVVGHVSIETMAELKQTALLEVGGLYLVAVALSLWAAWTLASAAAHRRQAVIEAERRGAQLSEANKLLTQTLYNLQVMQDDLVRAERLSSLGMMVAGIAEQLSGPLGVTSATLASLQERLAVFKAALRAGDVIPPALLDLKAVKDVGAKHADPSRTSILELLSHFQRGLNAAAENAHKAADLIAAFKQLAADRGECERRRFAMQDLLRDAVGAVSARLEKRHITVELNCPEDIVLDSYPGPLAQVVESLLRNVCDHAYGVAGGPLYISVRQRQEMMVMIIEDTGRGIPEEERRHLFGPFFGKDKASRPGKSAASGMGLYIAYRFVTETLDGKLSLKTVLGLGARFTIEVPLVAPTETWQAAGLVDDRGDDVEGNQGLLGDEASPNT